MNEFNLHPLLFELLNTKDFEALSQEEEVFISKHLSEELYKELRLVYIFTENVFKEEEEATLPDHSVKKVLDKAFEKKYKRKNIITDLLLSVIDYRIPAYQVALGGLILIMTVGWYIQSKSNSISSDSLLAVADTVFIEKEKTGRTDTVYIFQKENIHQTSSINSSQISKMEDSSLTENPNIIFPEQYNIYITDFKNISNPGKTMKEDSLPAGFMVGIL